MTDLRGLTAADLPVGTVIEIPAEGIRLRRDHGKKPWRQVPGRQRFSHAAVDGSIRDGEVKVISLGDVPVTPV